MLNIFSSIIAQITNTRKKIKLILQTKNIAHIFIRDKTKMSTLPQMFRTSYSSYMQPKKQGGIYAVKYPSSHNTQSYQTLQPEQFSYSKFGQSRIQTSHSIRSKKVVSFAQNPRQISSSQSQRRPVRKIYSRDSSASIRKDIFTNYGNSRVTFAIGQPIQASFQQAQSLLHKINNNIAQMQKNHQIFVLVTQQVDQIKQNIKEIKSKIQYQIKQIQNNAGDEFVRLRQVLSDLRRTSGMETKVNKTDLNQVKDGYNSIGAVMDQLDDISAQMYRVCLR